MKATVKVWRLEWPDGSGAYRGQMIETLLPPCYRVFESQWTDKLKHPDPTNDLAISSWAIGKSRDELKRWHFGFASREAFDAWFDPANLNFVNSPQCAAGMLQTVCYEVASAHHVVCGEHQMLFNPAHATKLESCPCQSLSSGTPTVYSSPA